MTSNGCNVSNATNIIDTRLNKMESGQERLNKIEQVDKKDIGLSGARPSEVFVI